MACRDKDIEEYRLKRDDILNEETDAAGQSTKIPRLRRALQEYEEIFDVIGLANFNQGHAPESNRSTLMTGSTGRGLSLRARAQLARTSMLFAILPVRRAAWLS